MLFAINQDVASASLEAPMSLETQVAEVPEPSESRYWCISDYIERFSFQTKKVNFNTKTGSPIATLPLGSAELIPVKAAALPELVHVHAKRVQ